MAIAFLNAFVDLGHKIIVQNAVFKIYDGETQVILTAVVNALILLPFIALFSPAGFISDKYPKHLVMRYGALAAIGITLLITACYYVGWFWPAFALTFVLAIQTALYSPAKYGYIRELVGDEGLAKGNAAVQAVTVMGILLGTFVFSGLFEMLLARNELVTTDQILTLIAPLGWLLVVLSMVELLFSYRLEAKTQTDHTLNFDFTEYRKLRYLRKNLSTIWQQPTIWMAIVGLSCFWGISQVMLASFPAFAKEALGETNTLVIQGVLACAGLGTILGSLLAGRVSKNYIETGLIPMGAIGIAICVAAVPQLNSAATMGLAFLLMGVAGGLFVVPLNALLQYHAEESRLGTILAGNNWVQNVTMISFLGVTVVFAKWGFSSTNLILLMAGVAVAGAIYTLRKLPHSFARIIVGILLGRRYKLAVVGFENLPKEGPVLLLGNHISFIDWAFVQLASPRPLHFVIERSYYNLWYLKPIFKLFGAIPIASAGSRQALSTMNEYLKAGEVVCLFPEGALSRNGQLSKFHSGYERTVEGVEEGVIVPFYLRGIWGSAFSRAEKEVRMTQGKRVQRDIIVAFGKQLPLTTKADELKQKVFELSIDAWEEYTKTLKPIPLQWFKRAKTRMDNLAAADTSGNSFTHRRLMAATLAFARSMRKISPEPNIGIMLPASSASIITNMAVLLNGQIAVNLNFTASKDAFIGSLAKAEIKTIYTSQQFLQKLRLRRNDIDELLEGRNIIILEELKESVPKPVLIWSLIQVSVLPAELIYRFNGRQRQLEDPACILFSSGSEGTPKGVVLSHQNIVANCKQISDVLNTRPDDVFLGNLPPFHCFGLTVTSLMPLVEGIPVVCHPDPMEVDAIAKAIARNRITVMCATATMLNMFSRSRKVSPLMMESLRLTVAGAEKLSDQVRIGFQSKFGKVIYEGYGTTETTPVASCNVPDVLDLDTWYIQYGNRQGTVGLPLPGSCFRVVDPDTMQTLPPGEAGLVLISGTQVMLGYLQDPKKTAQAIVQLDGRRWYKTGDKGYLSEEGFLTLVDRYSRFAKIAGEMISLAAVENACKSILGHETELLAVATPDARKGEKVVLLLEGDHDTTQVRKTLIDGDMDKLMLPGEFREVEEIPRLGSGKADFKAAQKMVDEGD